MNQLEKIAQLWISDLEGFGRFADLVKITVVKVLVNGFKGELGEGTLHSLVVKTLAEDQEEK